MDALRRSQPISKAAARGKESLLRLAAAARRHEPLIYAVFAGVLTLAVACLFYSSLRQQTQNAALWDQPQLFDHHTRGERSGPWSAPLDDVFIHFDFARATARGFPFEWSEGNGYSSGGTSLLYPFVLAGGYLIGFRGQHLMLWAAIVACVGVLSTLLASRRLFRNLPRWTSYLAPPALLGVGALNWTLFSGMEVALFLALWGLSIVAWDDFVTAAREGRANRAGALWLGLACALMVATRPEAATLVAVLGASAACVVWRRRGLVPALWTLGLAGVPGAAVVVGHAVANHLLTGDSTAAGALAKLEMHHPYLSSEQVWDAWIFHVKYQVLRITQHHFSSVPAVGWIVWVFAAVPLFFRRTRARALVLWSGLALWIVTVALNGQVRWQNERYTMPAVAWLLLGAALGLGALLAWATAPERKNLRQRAFVALPTTALVVVFAIYQAQCFRDQLWFFGRASRNILDQHIRAGEVIRDGIKPRPRRILLSDAGAIPYEADLPALDLIGLGGYGGLPFARATRLGVGAAVELIEHVPESERPDVMALYPSWWGTFPLWFGRRLGEVPVRGNVICGGASKVLYRSDWSSIRHSGTPFSLTDGERLVDSIDLADVLSEEAHGYQFSVPAAGFVDMKILADPRAPAHDLWDAGRKLNPGSTLGFRLTGFEDQAPARLLFRVAPAQKASFSVFAEGAKIGEIHLEPGDAWQEQALVIPDGVVRPELHFEVKPTSGDLVVHHVFAVQPRRKSATALVPAP